MKIFVDTADMDEIREANAKKARASVVLKAADYAAALPLCAADVLGVPFAWGLSSVVHGAPRLLLENGTASTAARAAGRAVADGLFVPIDECSLDASAITAARALACAGGAAYFSLQLVERARLALLLGAGTGAGGGCSSCRSAR